MSSSIHTSISSLSSSSSRPDASPRLPRARRASVTSSATRTRHAFHSSTARFRCATSSALTVVSSAASASSNAREYSRRFFLIFCFCLFVSNEGGRGRHRNCLNRSRSRFSISWPRKSQIAYPFSICGAVVSTPSRKTQVHDGWYRTVCVQALAAVARYRPLGSHSTSVTP
jgi:hypothetical protein